MYTIATSIATPTPAVLACPSRMSALVEGPGSSVEGRHTAADIAFIAAVRVPAFLKDVAGVRAWSPPV